MPRPKPTRRPAAPTAAPPSASRGITARAVNASDVDRAAEGLWLTALDEARRRAQLESGSTRTALARERQDLDLQAHVLSIREQELQDRLAAERPRVNSRKPARDAPRLAKPPARKVTLRHRGRR